MSRKCRRGSRNQRFMVKRARSRERPTAGRTSFITGTSFTDSCRTQGTLLQILLTSCFSIQVVRPIASLNNLHCAEVHHRRDNFVVGVSELVATYAEVLITHFVDCGLDRCSDHARYNLSAVDEIITRVAEITPVRYVSELAWFLE